MPTGSRMAPTPPEQDRAFYLECSPFLQRVMRSPLADEDKDRLIDVYYAVWLLARDGYLTMQWAGEAFQVGPTPRWQERFGEFSMARLAQVVEERQGPGQGTGANDAAGPGPSA